MDRGRASFPRRPDGERHPEDGSEPEGEARPPRGAAWVQRKIDQANKPK